jgi:hypothetical protein
MLEIEVVLTTPVGTRAALERVRSLAAGLDTEIRIVVAGVVPYPLRFPEARVGSNRGVPAFAATSGMVHPVDVVFSRSSVSGLCSVIRPGSIVALGDEGAHRMSRVAPITRALHRRGYDVVVVGATEADSRKA